MKNPGIATLAALALTTPVFADTVTGEYVEARSAAVYAGACHYNSELTTAGREAVLAWKVTRGESNGVTLDGLRVMALVSGGDNLAFDSASRRSVLIVEESATPEQRDALVALLKAKLGKSLGTVAAVKSAPIRFESDATKVSVSAGKNATLNVSRYPCKHCMMPATTWYAPVAPAKDFSVAQGIETGYSDTTLGITWSQASTDNVFIGKFSL